MSFGNSAISIARPEGLFPEWFGTVRKLRGIEFLQVRFSPGGAPQLKKALQKSPGLTFCHGPEVVSVIDDMPPVGMFF
jgi:hypothetical protein